MAKSNSAVRPWGTKGTTSDEGENFSSGGVGVRLRLHQANRVNLRVDFAWGEDDEDGFYVSLREAF